MRNSKGTEFPFDLNMEAVNKLNNCPLIPNYELQKLHNELVECVKWAKKFKGTGKTPMVHFYIYAANSKMREIILLEKG